MTRLLLAWVFAGLLWLGAGAALAQQTEVVPAEWNVVAARAEAVLESGQAQTESLETLRAELVEWRSTFQEASGTNAGRITTVQAEIDALGPAPEEGETEADEIAARRAELTTQLNNLQSPVRAAQAAFQAADSLISRTDALIEDQRAERLLLQEQAPLNPGLWWPALAALGAWFAALARDVVTPFATSTSRAYLAGQGIQIGVLLVASILLLVRSGYWLGRLRDRMTAREEQSPLARIGLFLVSLARLFLPVLGLMALARIIVLMGAQGIRVEQLIWALPTMGFVILFARWLGNQAFPPHENALALMPVAQDRRAEARFHVIMLGVILACEVALNAVTLTADEVQSYRGVYLLVMIGLAGLTVIRLGHLLLREGQGARDTEDGGLWAQIMRLVGRALMVIGTVAPLVTAAGYLNLGEALIWPAVQSLALLVVIGILQGVASDAYALATRQTRRADDALVPTLIGLVLTVGAMPAFALIWGVRSQTLLEWWTLFLDGFSVGETTISPSAFLTFVLVFVVGYLLTRLLKAFLRTNVLPKTKLDSGGTNAILSGTGYVGITIAALLAITTAGIDLSGLAIVAGALSVGIGFGLQTIVQNFVSGIILLIERPIKIGDWINVNGTDGFVRQISVRSTRIETFDKQDVIIPNADFISGTVKNYTLGNSSGRLLLPIGVAYGTDTRRVEALLREIVEAHPMVVLNPPPTISFEGFGADSLDFLCRVVLRDILFVVSVRSDLNHEIAKRFMEEGIEIPFAQRDLWLRNPEALRQAQTPESS